ncbi:DUF317 domain-containing protein [Streptomyces anulatus]|uniref:DUF317 domain-containing protein n=1 Tax=Streptomyces anulatus TaxID=1892 RepID=A0A6G3T1H3_STRAQ|nr:DUF317 domain-containing protein [Streptomyces anulatus]NEB89019.1 DUF317 domain-containing protein [Streptomyces anulatus]
MNSQNLAPNDATAQAIAAVAESGEHEALLNVFLDDHAEWQRWRTWSDETTHAVHESLALRAELVHEPGAANVRWRFAVYESPVGARLWHATAYSSTPTEVVGALLLSLATRAAEYPRMDALNSDEALVEATLPLADSGWTPAAEAPGWVRWRSANDDFFLRHDTLADRSTDSPAAWVLSGRDQNRSRWGINFSASAPPLALTAVTEALADCEARLRQHPATRSPTHCPPQPPAPPARGRRGR